MNRAYVNLITLVVPTLIIVISVIAFVSHWNRIVYLYFIDILVLNLIAITWNTTLRKVK